jgi:hypothetical protein
MQDDDGDDDAVDESWIKSSMDVSLFSSKALEFACSSTRGADLLQRYVHSNAVGRMVRALVMMRYRRVISTCVIITHYRTAISMQASVSCSVRCNSAGCTAATHAAAPAATAATQVTALRYEDPRVPSPRLAVLRAVYEHCPHLRLPLVRAATAAAHDRLCYCRHVGELAVALEQDAGAALQSAGGGGEAHYSRDQGQTLLELLQYVLDTLPEFAAQQAVAAGSSLAAQFEDAAKEAGATSSGSDAGSSSSAAAAVAAAAAQAVPWPPGVTGKRSVIATHCYTFSASLAVCTSL